MVDGKHCPCGSRKKFQYCCGKYLFLKEYPVTAEQLMRSRYTAFCLGNIDYLIATLHPSKRNSNDSKELSVTINQTTWLGLTIVDTRQGKKQDRIGYVEFMAVFQTSQPQQLHECSRFIKEDNRWFYIDGEILPDLVLQSSDRCWCGSNQKYRNCHGKLLFNP